MKKKKRVLTKAQRENILRTLSSNSNEAGNDSSSSLTNSTVNTTSNPTTTNQSTSQELLNLSTTNKELKKIGLVLAVVVAMLAVATYLNYKTPYLIQAGDILTKQLGL